MDRQDAIERATKLLTSESFSHGGLIEARLVKLSGLPKDDFPKGLVNDCWVVSFKLVEEPNPVEYVDSVERLYVNVDDVTGEASMLDAL